MSLSIQQVMDMDDPWLMACEMSGTVREEFRDRGIEAVSCDFKASLRPGPHYQGDVLDILYARKWRGVIAHPDCTYLANSGVRWLFDRAPSTEKVLKGPERWVAMLDACEFFRVFLDLDCDRVVVENPIMHRHAKRVIRRAHTQTIQPFEYGELQTKRTALWIKGLPALVPTNNVEREMRLLSKKEYSSVHYASPGDDRAEFRSLFFKGWGAAMAEQWGNA